MRHGEGIAAWLARSGEAVRDDARRALAELVARGDLTSEEARAIEEAVAGALERSTGFVTEHVLEPLRGLLRAATAAGGASLDDLAARLDALSERLERLERQLTPRETAGEDDQQAAGEGDQQAAGEDEEEPPCS